MGKIKSLYQSTKIATALDNIEAMATKPRHTEMREQHNAFPLGSLFLSFTAVNNHIK